MRSVAVGRVLPAVVCAGLCLALPAGDRIPAEPRAPRIPAASAAGVPVAARVDPAVRALLERRAAAVRDRDRDGFLAAVDPGAAEFRAAQARLFDRLTRLPFADWRYTVDGGDGAIAWVVLSYRLRGFDRDSVTRRQYVEISPRGLLAGDGRSAGLADDPEIWDEESVAVTAGRRSLVIGAGAGIAETAALVDQGIESVTRVWGSDWTRRAVVLVPGTAALAEALTKGGLSDIAALATVATGPAGVPGRGTGDRVVLVPEGFARLSETGRRIVLAHELTHVATRAVTTSTVPAWLVEGFADYIGYRDSGMSRWQAARELAREVRAGKIPGRLPGLPAFEADAPRLAQAYQEAWLACEYIATRWGEQTLVRLYREAERSSERAALATVLKVGPDRFTADWRRFVRDTLG
ncbi:hypothetical protein [Rhizohabitans arisaemae]|uniref:hypothetical protein n=1 Tax=Rhizohabitans arisaemae TaxID=2720610 RepID=UPI0024B06A1F|nr:hypothetical protein [Rhizohabitans arisaemae]